jgi:hypothetical protein
VTFSLPSSVALGTVSFGSEPVVGDYGTQNVDFITLKGTFTAGHFYFANARDITVDGAKVDKQWADSKAAFWSGNTNRTTLRNVDFCCVTDAPVMESIMPDGTTSPNANITIEDAKVHDMRRTSQDVHNECFLAGGVPGFTLNRTHWYGCTVMNFNFGAFGAASNISQKDFHFTNNVFESPTNFTETDKTYYPWFQGCNTPSQSTKPGWVIEYNVMESGWYTSCGDTGAVIRDNVGSRGWECPKGATMSRNIWKEGACGSTDVGKSDILSSANFRNMTGHDWSYPAGAFQINKGDPSAYPGTDMTGAARYKGSAPDAGPYEAG